MTPKLRVGKRRPKPRQRVHRHLFRAPVQGILVGHWSLRPWASPQERFEEEAP